MNHPILAFVAVCGWIVSWSLSWLMVRQRREVATALASMSGQSAFQLALSLAFPRTHTTANIVLILLSIFGTGLAAFVLVRWFRRLHGPAPR